jgi:PAS domain S-box-containing protein
LQRQAGWERFTGQDWPEYRDHGWVSAVHPDDRVRFVAAWNAALAARSADETPCRLWHAPSAAYRHVVARGVPIVENDEVREWVGTVTDVHDRTEAILRAAADAQLRTAVLQSLQDGVFVATAEGRMLDVNAAWSRLFGLSRDETVGLEPPYPWWPDADEDPEARRAIEDMRAILLDGAAHSEHEVVFRHADGHSFPALITISTIRDHGEITMLVGTVKDMTRHAEMDARVRAIAALTARLATADGLSQVGIATLEELLPLLGSGRGSVYLFEPDEHVLQMVATLGTADAGRAQWRRIPIDIQSPAVDAMRSRQLVEIVEQAEFCRRYPRIGEYLVNVGLHTTIHVPFVKGSTPVGVLFAAYEHERPLRAEEIDFLDAVAPIIAQALDRARLFEFQRSVASTLQRAMMISHPVAPVELAVAARYVPAVADLAVGGDWYDVVPLDGERVAIAVGDIVGRGVNAAAVMGQLRSALSALARTTDSTIEAVAHLDRFAHRLDGAKATTLLYGIVDPAAKSLRYTSAGHPPALLVDTDGHTTFLDGARGWPLGVADPDRGRPEAVAALPPGSTLVLYTDGLVERRSERIEDGLERLARAASARAVLPVERFCEELIDELVGEQRNDDVALVALRMSSVAAPSFTCRVRAAPDELAGVRGALRAWLEAHDLPEMLREDMVLAAGEACANAVEHAYMDDARATVVVEGFLSTDRVVVTVRDNGSWRPLVPNPRRNRGLRMIAEVTDGFEITRPPEGGTLIEMRRDLVAN